MSEFAERLKELRERAGLTQAQVAESIGVSGSYLSVLESGRKSPPPKVLVSAIAASIRASVDELWTLAQAEREERLRQRVQGDPTSDRVLTRTHSDAQLGAEDPRQLAAEFARDPKLMTLCLRLKQAFPDTVSRNAFVDGIVTMIAGLKRRN